MRKFVLVFVCALFLIIICSRGDKAFADVVIKVRALNPLETDEVATIKYPLPRDVRQEHIRKKNIRYSMEHGDEDNPPKTDFQIVLNQDDQIYYIEDEVFLRSKEVVTLEVHVKDLWIFDKGMLNKLRQETKMVQISKSLKEMIEEQEKESKAEEEEYGVQGEEGSLEKLTNVSGNLKEEIFKALDDILKKQEQNTILKVGVDRHIQVYEENRRSLAEAQENITMLKNLAGVGEVKEEDVSEEETLSKEEGLNDQEGALEEIEDLDQEEMLQEEFSEEDLDAALWREIEEEIKREIGEDVEVLPVLE